MVGRLRRSSITVMAIALLGMATAARGNTILVSFVSHIGNTFTYSAELSPNGTMQNGDGFTIFDFALPTGAVTTNLNWVYSTQLVGSPVSGGVGAFGAGLSPGGDSASTDNVSFVWNGGTVVSNGVINTLLGTFSITTNALQVGSDIVVTHDSSAAPSADQPYAFGPMTVASVVPLPATANMGLGLMLCLGGLGAWRRMKLA